MKKLTGIILVLGLLFLTFYGLNQLWNWVDLDETLLNKSVITVIVALTVLSALYWIGYVFFRKNTRYPEVGKKD